MISYLAVGHRTKSYGTLSGSLLGSLKGAERRRSDLKRDRTGACGEIGTGQRSIRRTNCATAPDPDPPPVPKRSSKKAVHQVCFVGRARGAGPTLSGPTLIDAD